MGVTSQQKEEVESEEDACAGKLDWLFQGSGRGLGVRTCSKGAPGGGDEYPTSPTPRDEAGIRSSRLEAAAFIE